MWPVATHLVVRSVGLNCDAAETAELIEVLFGLGFLQGPRNHYDMGLDPPRASGNLGVGSAAWYVRYCDHLFHLDVQCM